MLKLRLLRVKNALVRECMAEFLGTFVLLVSDNQASVLAFEFEDTNKITQKLKHTLIKPG